MVIYCTGYRYAFPFLNEMKILAPNDEHVSPLYMHMVHVDYPDSLFFIGMNLTVLPFILFDIQVKYAMALVEGRSEKPTTEEFDKEDQKRLKYAAFMLFMNPL